MGFLFQMNLLIFQNPFFLFFLRLWKYRYWKKFKTITVQPSVQLFGKFLCVIWNIVTKYIQNSWRYVHFSKLRKKLFKNVIIFFFKFIQILKNQYSFKIKKDRSPDYSCFMSMQNIYMFLYLIRLTFSNFCYIVKLWNSDRFELLAGSVFVRCP